MSNSKSLLNDGSIRQPVLFTGQGNIFVGHGTVFGVENSPSFYSGYSYIESRLPCAKIKIGCGVWLNNSVVIISNGSAVVICDNVLIGWDVQIIDSDFHPLDPKFRKSNQGNSSPIHIGENAWIGSNVRIFKGVTIGSNSIISNGSIVTKSIPDNVIAGGIPAKVIRTL